MCECMYTRVRGKGKSKLMCNQIHIHVLQNAYKEVDNYNCGEGDGGGTYISFKKLINYYARLQDVEFFIPS